MNKLQYREFYRRHLPHIQMRGFAFFITFRLANSLPRDVMENLVSESKRVEGSLAGISDTASLYLQKERQQQLMFEKWDDALHSSRFGNCYLKIDNVASIVQDSIHYH